LIGNFKNAGRTWCREAEEVNVHDFPQDAERRATPYGIYDIAHNLGYVAVGTSADTSEFAVDAICWWWELRHRHELCAYHQHSGCEGQGRPGA